MFNEKLNYNPSETYKIKENIELRNGIYEGILKHDNIIESTVVVKDTEGYIIENFSLEKVKGKPWSHKIVIQSSSNRATIEYHTIGDTVDADDINDINKNLLGVIQTMKNLDVTITNLNERVEKINRELNGLDNRINTMNGTMDDLNGQINKMDSEVSDLSSNIINVNSKLNTLDGNVTKLNNTYEDYLRDGLTWGNLRGRNKM